MNSTALFELARFNVLTAAVTPGACEHLDNAYVYAWDDRVYPVFHDSKFTEAFEGGFDIPRNELEALFKYLDDKWLEKDTPSFYKLEDEFDVRMGTGFWNRSRLMHALRYARLSDRFDEAFFAAILAPTDHPIEASLIADDYARLDAVGLQ